MPKTLIHQAAAATRATFCAAVLALAWPAPSPGQAEGTITPNYKDAEISQIIEAVSAVTGKNFIVDPRVRAQVTMLSSTPMTPAAFYEAFLSILQVHGFVAVSTGDIVKIVPDANARQLPGNDLPSRVSSTSDEIVTQVIAVRNVSAAQLVPILRPLIPQYGHLAAYDPARDTQFDMYPADHLFAPSTTRLGLRYGVFLRGYVYAFISLFAPRYDRAAIDAALEGRNRK